MTKLLRCFFVKDDFLSLKHDGYWNCKFVSVMQTTFFFFWYLGASFHFFHGDIRRFIGHPDACTIVRLPNFDE